jgi:saccharopine dehydrogenase-like NADP-dependent oxidoreductase
MKIKLSELRHLVKKIIKEQVETEQTYDPRWIKLFSVLKGLGNPKTQEYKYNGKQIQSLKWGSTYYPTDYAISIDSESEHISFQSKDKKKEAEIKNWWTSKGYTAETVPMVKISYDDYSKIATDLKEFFRMYPPVKN